MIKVLEVTESAMSEGMILMLGEIWYSCALRDNSEVTCFVLLLIVKQ